jgi:hypothetical protein
VNHWLQFVHLHCFPHQWTMCWPEGWCPITAGFGWLLLREPIHGNLLIVYLQLSPLLIGTCFHLPIFAIINLLCLNCFSKSELFVSTWSTKIQKISAKRIYFCAVRRCEVIAHLLFNHFIVASGRQWPPFHCHSRARKNFTCSVCCPSGGSKLIIDRRCFCPQVGKLCPRSDVPIKF